MVDDGERRLVALSDFAPLTNEHLDEQGNADCETGQRGYPARLTKLPGRNVVTDPRTPGNQGPTYSGKRRVPEGQKFTAEPGGLAPEVAGK